MFIIILAGALLVVYLLSIVLGRFLMTKCIAPLPSDVRKWLLQAIIRAGLYTPTFAAGGHGVAILPGAFALIFSETRHFPYVLPLPLVVFVCSLLISLVRQRLADNDSEQR